MSTFQSAVLTACQCVLQNTKLRQPHILLALQAQTYIHLSHILPMAHGRSKSGSLESYHLTEHSPSTPSMHLVHSHVIPFLVHAILPTTLKLHQRLLVRMNPTYPYSHSYSPGSGPDHRLTRGNQDRGKGQPHFSGIHIQSNSALN